MQATSSKALPQQVPPRAASAGAASSQPVVPPVRRRAFAPLEPIGARARVLLGLGFFVVFVLVWSLATLGGFVSPTFLASPPTMVKEGWLLFTEYGFIGDIGMLSLIHI